MSLFKKGLLFLIDVSLNVLLMINIAFLGFLNKAFMCFWSFLAILDKSKAYWACWFVLMIEVLLKGFNIGK